VTTLAPRKSMEPYLLDSVKFYNHQIEGVRKLMRWKSFLLADDMGLGKSLQALTVFIGDVVTGRGGVCLVICPTTLKENWSEEISKFTRVKHMVLGSEYNPKTGRPKTLTSGERSRQIVEFAMWEEPKILVLNYEQVDPHLAELNALGARVAIFDEAHTIKNPEAKRTKACLELKSDRSFMLTGTPVMNQVHELWPALNRIAPQHFSNPYAFKNRYCVYGGYKNKQIVGVKNRKELTAILEQLMLRRLKKDVLDLPEVQEIQVKVGLSELQQKLYDQVDEEMLLDVDPHSPPEEIENAMTKFLRLKQITGTPACFDLDDDSHKLDVVIEKALELIEDNHKIVIFTQFRPVLTAIRNRLDKVKVSSYELSGAVKQADRQDVVRSWSSDKRPLPIVCMLQVAGVGLNMTASRHMLFVDKLFVPGLNQQAIDRCHRIGASTTQNVQVLEFIARGTIEDRIEAILRAKKKLFKDVIESVGFMSQLLQALQDKEDS